MTRVSYRREREFGLVVGAVFLLLALWWLSRAKFPNAVTILLPLGSVLMVLALVAPASLKYPSRPWLFLAEVLGFVSTRIILGLVFFLVVTPIGVVKRLRGWNPLGRRGAGSASYWRDYSERQHNPRHYEKMF